MKKTMKLVLVSMFLLTAIYFGAVVYAIANPGEYKDVVLSARELDTQPPTWYTPEQLGITEIIEQQGWVQVIVPKEKAKQLQEQQPVFKYKDKFYRITGLWATPGLPESVKQGIVPAGVGIGAGWILVGAYIHKNRKETKKKIALTGLVCLLITLTCTNIPILPVNATSEENLWVTPGLPEEVRKSERISNTTEGYLNITNMTNPYSEGEPLAEINEVEGSNPIYALVFGDEEERSLLRRLKLVGLDWVDYYWNEWAHLQIERGDKELVANHGIDIRILGYKDWDSDDSIDSMYDLWDELEADTKHYLGQWYDGANWDNYVDIIIGITAQATIENIAGLSSGYEYIDQGRSFTLLKWQTYWADDNLMQHEISHHYHPPGHWDPCCVMAYHKHFQTWINEDALWWVFNTVGCAFTSYHWCTTCNNLLSTYQRLYENADYMLIIRHGIPEEPRGTISPGPGINTYESPTSVTISVVSADPPYHFSHWLVDGKDVRWGNSITISVNSKHTVAAYFRDPSVGGIEIPIDKSELPAHSQTSYIPYIELTLAAMTMICAIAYLKIRKKGHPKGE